jgi:hypothetical protein
LSSNGIRDKASSQRGGRLFVTRPNLSTRMLDAHNRWQQHVNEWLEVVRHMTLLIDPLITIIQEYHGRCGYGDVVLIQPDGSIGSQ